MCGFFLRCDTVRSQLLTSTCYEHTTEHVTNSLVQKLYAAFIATSVIGLGGGVIAHAEPPTSPSLESSLTANQTHHIKSGGDKRTYRLSLPSNWKKLGPLPVIFAFHGHGQDAQQMETYSDLDHLPALVVYPQGEKGTGNSERAWESAPYARTNKGNKDSQFVHDLLGELTKNYPIDHARIYATGKSNGGGFAAKLGCTMPNIFAAVAPVAGAYYKDTHTGHGGRPEGCEPTNNTAATSIMEVHGTNDHVIQYSGGVSHKHHFIGGPELVREFAQRYQCDTPPVENPPEIKKSQEYAWRHCEHEVEAIHYKIIGGGHTWPGSSHPELSGKKGEPFVKEFPTTDKIWQFFSRHHH